jgi:hypothetical protein
LKSGKDDLNMHPRCNLAATRPHHTLFAATEVLKFLALPAGPTSLLFTLPIG